MDTTGTYRSMMDKAWPYLKKSWRWDKGDFYFDRREGYLSVGVWCDTFDYGEEMVGSAIPLPRQDELQEMLGFCGASGIHGWMKRVTLFQMESPYQSFEQLWLAFVLKEKYNKIWNGEEWVESK